MKKISEQFEGSSVEDVFNKMRNRFKQIEKEKNVISMKRFIQEDKTMRNRAKRQRRKERGK